MLRVKRFFDHKEKVCARRCAEGFRGGRGRRDFAATVDKEEKFKALDGRKIVGLRQSVRHQTKTLTIDLSASGELRNGRRHPYERTPSDARSRGRQSWRACDHRINGAA